MDKLRAEVAEWRQVAKVEAKLRREFREEADRLRAALVEIKRLNEKSGFNGCAIARVYSKHLPP